MDMISEEHHMRVVGVRPVGVSHGGRGVYLRIDTVRNDPQLFRFDRSVEHRTPAFRKKNNCVACGEYASLKKSSRK